MSTGNTRTKTGPERPYSADELARFARFRDQRALYRPAECTMGGSECWVEQGPPAISRSARCLGCDGIPKGFATTAGAPPAKYPRAG